jgi:hypothetical protein
MTQTTAPEIKTVTVPGGELYVEIRGSGRVLLLITGGPTDAGMFTDLAGRPPVATRSCPTSSQQQSAPAEPRSR